MADKVTQGKHAIEAAIRDCGRTHPMRKAAMRALRNKNAGEAMTVAECLSRLDDAKRNAGLSGTAPL